MCKPKILLRAWVQWYRESTSVWRPSRLQFSWRAKLVLGYVSWTCAVVPHGLFLLASSFATLWPGAGWLQDKQEKSGAGGIVLRDTLTFPACHLFSELSGPCSHHSSLMYWWHWSLSGLVKPLSPVQEWHLIFLQFSCVTIAPDDGKSWQLVGGRLTRNVHLFKYNQNSLVISFPWPRRALQRKQRLRLTWELQSARWIRHRQPEARVQNRRLQCRKGLGPNLKCTKNSTS